MHLGYNWLISQKTVPINASFVNQWLLVMSTYQSFLCIRNSIDDMFLSFFSRVISTYPRMISRHPSVVSDIRFVTLQISLMYGFTGK